MTSHPRSLPEELLSPRFLVSGLVGVLVSMASSSAAVQSNTFGIQQVITTSADSVRSAYATDLDGDVLSASSFLGSAGSSRGVSACCRLAERRTCVVFALRRA